MDTDSLGERSFGEEVSDAVDEMDSTQDTEISVIVIDEGPDSPGILFTNKGEFLAVCLEQATTLLASPGGLRVQVIQP